MSQVEASSKAFESSLGKTQESKLSVERVTLGAAVGCINSTAEKLVSIHARRTLIESFHQPSRYGVVAKDDVKNPYKPLVATGTARIATRRPSLLSHYRQGKVALVCGRPETERTLSVPFPSRLSKAGCSVSFLTRNEKENNYDDRETQRNKTNSQNRSLTWQAKDAQEEWSSIAHCRPYMRISTPFITVNNDENSSQEKVELENTRKPSQSECKSTERHGESEVEGGDNCAKKLSVNGLFNSRGEMQTVKDSNTIEEHITLDEKEVLNRFTDRQLKESLQNIIKTRRSSVRLFRSETGYGLVNLCENESCKDENLSPQYNEQPSPIMEVEKPFENHLQSVTARKKSATHEWSPSAPNSDSEGFRGEGSFPMRPRSREATGQETGRATTRKISSAQSFVSTTSNWTQRSLSSPLLRRRKTAFQTGETRVVLPASAKAYTPTFTKRRLRKKSSVSCPESSHDKHKAKTLREAAMVREFLLMYAKVKTKKISELHHSKPVPMMSQTPELVIKSAIGQFLTRAFPSENNANSQSKLSKAERYEEQQRCRLLRIKICMKHLAAVA